MFIDIALWTCRNQMKEILQLESLRYFYFRNLLIWKFMYRTIILLQLELLPGILLQTINYKIQLVQSMTNGVHKMYTPWYCCTVHIPAPGKNNLIPQKSGSIQIRGDHPLLSFEIWLKTWGYTEHFYLPMVDRHLLEMMGPRCFQVIFIKYALHFVSRSFSTWAPVISSPEFPYSLHSIK